MTLPQLMNALLQYIDKHPEHPFVVELDSNGQVVIFTGLRIFETITYTDSEVFESIDYYKES